MRIRKAVIGIVLFHTLIFGIYFCYSEMIYRFKQTARDYLRKDTKIKYTQEIYDWVDNVTYWKSQQSLKLGNLVQRRLEYLQNPNDCRKAKKLVCTFRTRCYSGMACLIHFMTYCLVIAYGTGRTLIVENDGWNFKEASWESFFKPFSNNCRTYDNTSIKAWGPRWDDVTVQVLKIASVNGLTPWPKFMPMAIPEDLAASIQRFHSYPAVWWLGQLVKFLIRPQDEFLKNIKERERMQNFKHPVVGVHIRRTDKIGREAEYHSVDEYMHHVEKWFNRYEMRHPGVKRRVYLATDEPTVIEEAQRKYTNYTFITDVAIVASARRLRQRIGNDALAGVLTDIHLLSMCDFLVVTFSSNVGRVAYMLMQTKHGDASRYAQSLDHIFHFLKVPIHVTAIEAHSSALPKNELEFRPGDIIQLAWETRGDDFFFGKNTRTKKTGIFPSNKTINIVTRTVMPIYPDINDSVFNNNALKTVSDKLSKRMDDLI